MREALGRSGQLQALLPAIAAASQAHAGVYLVGGAVRDLLLGAETVDTDLMVEGDALGFARQLAAALGVEAFEHERFQTAVVKGEGPRGPVAVDVAAARKETYAQPGALPKVALAGLGEDLSRRDFTINALACSLKAGDRGTTHDPFGGYADLGNGIVRVLHERSFLDDPTRLLRAVRYEARLSFEMEPHTRQLAGEAIASDLPGRLASARVRDELLDLLSERRAGAALARLADLGLDRALNPGLSYGEQARGVVARLDQAVISAGLSGRVDLTLARLAAICTQMSAGEIGAWLDHLKFASGQRDRVLAAATAGPPLATRLDALSSGAPSKLHDALSGLPEEALAVAAAVSDQATGMIAAYVERIEPVRLEIGGQDLIAAGVPQGPAIGRALRTTLALKLDGSVDGREQELAAALGQLGNQTGAQ